MSIYDNAPAAQPLEAWQGNLGTPQTLGGNDYSTVAGAMVNSLGSSTAPGGGSYSGVAANPLIGIQTQQINDQLGRLDNQQNIGLNNILGSYNAAFNTLTNQRNRAQEDYNTGVNQTTNQNVAAKQQIDTGVHNNLTGLQRLLSARGAGSSSAANVMAPYAAGEQGNQQRQQVQHAFGANMGALDTNWKREQNDFENSFGGLSTDRANRENALRAQIDSTRANLLNTKQQITGDPALTGQINDLGHQIDSLGAVQSFTPQVVNVTNPDLANYNYDPTVGPTASNPNASGLSNLGAFFNLTQDKKKAGATL